MKVIFKRMCRHTFFLCVLTVGMGGLVLSARVAHATDEAGERKRAALAAVKRLVVVPPFFGTDTLAKAAALEKSDAATKDAADTGARSQSASPADERLKRYAEQLRKLEEKARTRLPERTAARTPYAIVPADELTKALKQLDLSPAALFQNNGRIRNGKMAAPNPEAVRKLAAALHADAILLGTLDEPRKNNGGLDFDPLYGLGMQSPHVLSKGSFYVLRADGSEILHSVLVAFQPRTRIGNREFPLADWQEADALLIEDLMDELTRYTPSQR